MMCKQGGENQTGHSSFNESSRLKQMEIVWWDISEERVCNETTLGSPLKSSLNTKKNMHGMKLQKSDQE